MNCRENGSRLHPKVNFEGTEEYALVTVEWISGKTYRIALMR